MLRMQVQEIRGSRRAGRLPADAVIFNWMKNGGRWASPIGEVIVPRAAFTQACNVHDCQRPVGEEFADLGQLRFGVVLCGSHYSEREQGP